MLMVIFIGFFYYKHQSRQYDSPILFSLPLRFRKHKGHDLAYDVNIMMSQQRLSRIVTSTFL
jgi:hypothetical protein